MFWLRYKEDALKWREQEEKKRQELLKGRAKAEVKVTLVCDGTGTIKLKKKAKIYCVNYNKYIEWVASAVDDLEDKYATMKKQAATEGLEVDGVFYLPHRIKSLELGEITEWVEEEEDN